MSSLNAFAKAFFLIKPLDKWYTSRTLNTVLQQWKNIGTNFPSNSKEFLKILCYNIDGWGIRVMEVIELIYKVQASICIFTEVEELWNTCWLPHFNKFYQKGTNRNDGVCIAVGKHLKAMRVDIDIPNTVIIAISSLSEAVRIIDIYWLIPVDHVIFTIVNSM
jgi:hypothetical protein